MKNNNYSLENKFSLITGASGLLGYEHASALLDIGSNLVLTDLDIIKLKKLKKKLTQRFPYLKIMIFRMDVASEKSIKKTLSILKKNKINIDVLINNAAIDSKVKKNNKMTNSGKLNNISLSLWNKHLEVGLTGAMLCSKHFGNMMIKNKNGGVILNIASDLSVVAPNHSIYSKGTYKPVMYSVIKHGIVGLTKYISTHWNNHKIRCNAISPGPIKTDQPKSFVIKLKKQIPLNRLAQRDEYRGAIQFLCTDASKYMTGQNIIIDGGRSVW